jgi:hypothetical protein
LESPIRPGEPHIDDGRVVDGAAFASGEWRITPIVRRAMGLIADSFEDHPSTTARSRHASACRSMRDSSRCEVLSETAAKFQSVAASVRMLLVVQRKGGIGSPRDNGSTRGTFKLDQHQNVNKGIKVRGPIAREVVEYLLSIRPPNVPVRVRIHNWW